VHSGAGPLGSLGLSLLFAHVLELPMNVGRTGSTVLVHPMYGMQQWMQRVLFVVFSFLWFSGNDKLKNT
jgi:uncharacterized protein (DUF486 family)